MEKLLILGGTSFIGRNLVETLLERRISDFDIYLFNRGETNPDLFPQVHWLKGDRNTDDVAQLGKIEWDYVIDLSCYFPDSLQAILTYLPSSLKRYIFVSTVSVYQLEEGKLHEEAALSLKTCTAAQRIDQSDQSYGNRKAACENILAASNLDYLILRPALVYGAYDPTDRLYYWLYQVKTQAEVMIPERGENPISVSYVQDVVTSLLAALRLPQHQKIYHIISTPSFTISQLVGLASQVLNRTPRLINVAADILKAHEIQQWVDIPLWVEGDYWTFANDKIQRDFQITFTDFEASIRATIAYYEALQWPIPSYGISTEKSQAVRTALREA